MQPALLALMKGRTVLAPDQIPGLEWWHDADQSTLTLSGNDVTAWAVKAGTITTALAKDSTAAAVQSGTAGTSNYAVKFDLTAAAKVYEKVITGHATDNCSLLVVVQSEAGTIGGLVYEEDEPAAFGESITVQYSTSSGRIQFFAPDGEGINMDGTGDDAVPHSLVGLFSGSVFRALYMTPAGVRAEGTPNDIDGDIDANVTVWIGHGAAVARVYRLFTIARWARVLSSHEIDGLFNYVQDRWFNQEAEEEPPFSPDDIAGMLWWHDSVLSTLAMDGSDVTQWEDLSGNARHWTQSAGSEAPHTRTNNGRLLVDFDGSAQFMTMGSGHGITTAAHIFMVVVFDAYENSDSIIFGGANADTDDGFNWRMHSTANTINLLLSDGSGSRDSLSTLGVATFTPGTASVIEVYFDGTNTYGNVIDGVEATEAASQGGCTGPDTVNLMARTSGGNVTDGAVAVTLAYSAPITGDDLTALRTYLQAIAADINA